jgi:hypothetical protein
MMIKERIEAWSMPEPNSGCWIWLGNIGHHKTGDRARMSVRNKKTFAYRAAYEAYSGKTIPEGMVICHRCDNPICVNPDHLWVGTQADNLRDMYRKRRHVVVYHIGHSRNNGENNPRARLTVDNVIAIRNSTETSAELGRRYGVSRLTIRDVRSRRNWKDVA